MQKEKDKKQEKGEYIKPVLINHGKLNDITAGKTGVD
jgi:hypothetical protein